MKGYLRVLLFDQKERTLLMPGPKGTDSAGRCVGFAELDYLEDSSQQVAIFQWFIYLNTLSVAVIVRGRSFLYCTILFILN